MASLQTRIKKAALEGQISPLKEKVFLALIKIPKGTVTTYGALAKSIDCKSPRAIGQALKHNLFAPIVPCHRVIASNLQLHGFQGSQKDRALNNKKELLQQEGIKFDKDNKVLKNHIYQEKQ